MITSKEHQDDTSKRIRLQQNLAEMKEIQESGAAEDRKNEWYNKKSGVPQIDFAYPEYDNGVTSKEYDAPIIFLTAYSGETDKIMGFSAGADDYIVKPFSNMELLMRVRAILRRNVREIQREQVVEADNQVKIQDLVLDLDHQSIVKKGEIVPLTYTEYKILELLATHKKKIFSLENIYQSIWDEAVGDSAIMVHIKNIRKKIGDDSRNPKYIKTAWGKGYYVE